MKLLVTSVVRGSEQGESHGGVYLVDISRGAVRQVIDWDTVGIDWQGRGWDRGLRGIAFDGDTVYIAASDELFAYSPDFDLKGSWRNPYLKHCHEIAVCGRRLLLTSTGFDSILGFNLDARRFDRGLHVARANSRFRGIGFDPASDRGPLMVNKLHINNVHCDAGVMYISGRRTGGLLRFDGNSIRMSVELPPDSHNAQPFRNGVLWNDSESDSVRYLGPGNESAELANRRMPVPQFRPESLTHNDGDQSRLARQGFARGLCVLPDGRIVGGSSPSTVTIYDLAANERLMSVNLSKDLRNAVHGLEVWPFC